MAPKRPRDSYSILLDCAPNPITFDKHNRPTAAVAYQQGEAKTYILKREWSLREDANKPQRNNWYIMDNFLDNPGVTSWTVNEPSDKNVATILEGSGLDQLFPFVYIIKQENPLQVSLFKIGCSFDPEKRKSVLQTGNPFELEIHNTYKASDKKGDFVSMYALERALHLELKEFGGPFSTSDTRDAMPRGMICGREWFCSNSSSLQDIDKRIVDFLSINKHIYPSPSDVQQSFEVSRQWGPSPSSTPTARPGDSDVD